MLSEWMNENKEIILRDLCQMIAVPSVKRKQESKDAPYGKFCQEIAALVSRQAKGYGLDVFNDDNQYLVVHAKDFGKRPSIGVFCHLDVVPEGQEWRFPPYELTEKEDYYIGRGVGDNKGASAITLHLLRYFASDKLKNYDLFAFFGLDEESGMSDIKEFLKHFPQPDVALVPDVELPICIGEKSRLVFSLYGRLDLQQPVEIRAGVADNVIPQKCEAKLFLKSEEKAFVYETVGGHAAFPTAGSNAAAGIFLQLLHEERMDKKDKTQLSTLSKWVSSFDGTPFACAYTDSRGDCLTMVCTGLNLMQDGVYCLRYDCRFPTDLTIQMLEDKLTHFCSEKNLVLRVEKRDPSIDKNLDSTLVEALLRICNDHTGRQDSPYRMGGGTYARHLNNGLGVGIGQKFEMPGFVTQGHGHAHQADECIPQQQLWNGFCILGEAIHWIDDHYRV